MKNLFSSYTWTPATRHWLGQLGQEETVTTVDEAERNRILAVIEKTKDQARELEELKETYAETPLETLLGADYAQYTRVERAVESFDPTVDAVFERLSDPDPEFWRTPSTQEAAALRAWTGGVAQLLSTLNAHVRPGEPVEPATPAPRAPGAMLPREVTLLGLPQTTVLVAGSLALGFGVLLYALWR